MIGSDKHPDINETGWYDSKWLGATLDSGVISEEVTF